MSAAAAPAAAPSPERARRLTLSQIVEALLTRRPEHSAVRLARNARGDTQVEVVVRSGDEGADTVDAAARKATALYDELCGRYPLAAPEPDVSSVGTAA